MYFYFINILLLSQLQIVNTDLFTGTSPLRLVSDTENILLPQLKEVLKMQQRKVEKLKLILDSLKSYGRKLQTTGNYSAKMNYVLDDPVENYHFVKRWYLMGSVFKSPNYTLSFRSRSNEAESSCDDLDTNCSMFSKRGDCKTRSAFMKLNCRLSCGICKKDVELEVVSQMCNLTKQTSPTQADLIGAQHALVRLQRTYKLRTQNLISGNILSYKSAHGLELDDIVGIGFVAHEAGEWGLSIQWFKQALFIAINKTCDLEKIITYSISQPYKQPLIDITQMSNIIYKMAYSYILMNDSIRAEQVLDGALSVYKTADRQKKNRFCTDKELACFTWAETGNCKNKYKDYMAVNCKFSCELCKFNFPENYPGELKMLNLFGILKNSFKHKYKAKPIPEPNRKRKPVHKLTVTYEKLCRKEMMRHYKNAACKYRPALIAWNIYKEEIITVNPRISIIYNVINDAEAHMLIEISKRDMNRAKVGDSKTYSTNRVSNVGWLLDSYDITKTLSQRVSMITGLETQLDVRDTGGKIVLRSAEPFQAVNYGIGGHYEPHTDFFPDANKRSKNKVTRPEGDRIATFLLYLSDVEAGGGTVFPDLKIHLPPTKNAAAFWYNSHLSGYYDKQTAHAGCPVLLGEKWVCNKWIREFGNHFKRRCRTAKDELYSIDDIG